MISNPEKKLLRGAILANIFLFVATMLGAIGFLTVQKNKTSKTYFNANLNSLLIRDYRSAKINLENASQSNFSCLEYFDQNLAFTVGKQCLSKKRFFDISKNYYVKIGETLNPNRRLVFHYSLAEIAPVLLLLWVIILVIELPFGVYLFKKYKFNLNQKAKAEELKQLGRLSKQVAHDIRSPLSALKTLSSNFKMIDTDSYELFNHAIQRIESIATDILCGPSSPEQNNSDRSLDSCAPILTSDKQEFQITNISVALLSLITEKMTTISNKEINLNSTIEPNIKIKANRSDFQRVISNLINNSIESIGKLSGFISVSLTKENQNIIIEIRDNGCGIPSHLIDKVITEGNTYNKIGGSGIGLSHAAAWSKSLYGDLQIFSQEGRGTTVAIKVPDK